MRDSCSFQEYTYMFRLAQFLRTTVCRNHHHGRTHVVYMNIPVRNDTAMTGEITLQGWCACWRYQGKDAGGRRSGIRRIILPRKMKRTARLAGECQK